MADDLEKAINTAYGGAVSPQARASAMQYLSQLSESAGGWRTFVDKLFGTSEIRTALVCLSVLGDVVLHRYAFISLPLLSIYEGDRLPSGLLTSKVTNQNLLTSVLA